jgi:hypothetical protein
MSDAANIRSLDALRKLRVALLRFEDEARRSSSSLIVESQRVLNWLQLEQPQYWKRQVEIAYQQLAEARASLMKCRMRRTGDFKPTCYDEQKALERAKSRLERTRHMVTAIRKWTIKSTHEVDEYTSRAAQLNRCLDGEIPRAVALLENLLTSLDKYADLKTAPSLNDLYEAATARDEDSTSSTGGQTTENTDTTASTPAQSVTAQPIPKTQDDKT